MGDDLMEDLFGDLPSTSPKQQNKQRDERGTSTISDVDDIFNGLSESTSTKQRTDSDLDELFGELGISTSSIDLDDAEKTTPKKGSKSGTMGSPDSNPRTTSLGDIDSFLDNIMNKNSSSSSLNKDGQQEMDDSERVEFMNWLEDGDEISLNTSSAKIMGSRDGKVGLSMVHSGSHGDDEDVVMEEEEDSDDEVDFYVDETTGEMVGPSSPNKNMNGQKDEEGADDGSTNKQEEEEEEKYKDEQVLPLPKIAGMMNQEQLHAIDFEPRELKRHIEEVAEASMSITEAESKVKNRLETLFEIEQYETNAILSALSIKGLPGLIMPSDMRLLVWKALLCEDVGTPDWYSVPEDRFEEIFPSVRKKIQTDCAEISQYIGINEDSLVLLTQKLTLRSPDKAYHTILAQLSAVCLSVASNDTEKASCVLEALCLKWGGRKGDWSSTGLHVQKDAIGVGGAAFAKESYPLVEIRRHLILQRLVAFYDPKLSLVLCSERCPGWDILTEEFDIDEIEQVPTTVQKLIRLAGNNNFRVPISRHLFGMLAGSNLLGSSSQLFPLWDATIVSGRHPQSMAFLFAVAILLVNRDNLLIRTETPIDLSKLSIPVENRTIDKLVSVTLALADHAPEFLMRWISEEELLLPIPNEREHAMFLNAQKELKAKEQALLLAKSNVEDDCKTGTNEQQQQNQQEESVDEPSDSGEAEPTKEQKSSWTFSADAWKRRAQNIKSALAIATTGVGSLGSIDWSKYYVQRRLVEFYGGKDRDIDEELGLTFQQGMNGLQISAVQADSIAGRTGLVHAGDLAMSLNGLLVLGLGPSDVLALIRLQEKPFYMVIATLLPKDKVTEAEYQELTMQMDPGTLLCPSLEDRVAKYYALYNPEKEKEAHRILGIYSHREPVLLEELQLKYMDHVLGDPFHYPISHFVVPVDPQRLVEQLSFNEHMQQQQSVESPMANQTKKKKTRKLFVVDCRPRRSVAATGRFPTCYLLDPTTLEDPDVQEKLRETFTPMRGDLDICVMGRGTDALLADFNPKLARITREKDRRAVDTVALFLLKLGIPCVGVVQGGFLGCYMAMHRLGFSITDCLVNVPENRSALNKYDAFIRYHKASPAKAAAFLASKAKQSATSYSIQTEKKGRADTSISFSGIDDDKSINLVNKASQLFNTVWSKKSERNILARPDEKPAAPEPSTTGIATTAPGNTETGMSTSSFFNSVFSSKKDSVGTNEKDSEQQAVTPSEESEKQQQTSSSWGGWSSRLKSFKVPVDTTNLGTKLRSSVNQAYTAASQRLEHAAKEMERQKSASSTKPAAFQVDEETDPALLEKVRNLKKEDLVCLNDIGKHAAFVVEKEKQEPKLQKTFQVRRILVITCEQFLVLDPHPMREGYGYVKSNRTLKKVARLRFPNNDPSCISLFYAKDDDTQRSYIYRFTETANAKAFTKTIMHACARFNSKNEAKQETQHDAENAQGDESTGDEI